MTGGDVVRGGVRVVGELLITAGLVVLLFAAYLLWGTNLKTAAAQDDLRAELRREWASAAPAEAAPAPVPTPLSAPVPAPEAAADPVPADPVPADPATEPSAAPAAHDIGDGMALLRFPSLGDDAGHVVVEGVTVAALRKGPGHYPGTADPGQVGNTVISGHRTTYGAPFADIGELRAGDNVVVETADAVHTYRVTGLEIVAPTAIEVTYPVPGRPGAVPTQSLLTLTTCHPKFSARQRLVVVAELAESVPSGPVGA